MIKGTIVIMMALVVSLHTFATEHDKTLNLEDSIDDLSTELPVDIENNLDQLVIEWNNNFKSEYSCNQFLQGEIDYPDSVYINRLYSLPSEMELAFNKIVKNYIDMYTSSSRRRESVGYILAKGNYYFPMMEETLDRYGLPLELKYLSVIESALNPTVKSRMGATGLWQFMLRTGKMYGLEVNTLVDERKDPRKATDAAARYLKDLYDIYGDWNLVIAAYNCGPGNVNKAIRRSGGLTDYWAIYPYLPRETRGYVPGFIAATYIMNYYQQHNICPAESSVYPPMVDTLLVDRHLHLKQVSEKLEIPLEELRLLNPQYQKDIIPGNFKSYPLCLPAKHLSAFIDNQHDIFGNTTLIAHRKTVDVDESFVTATGKATKVHKVKRGESLGGIAQKYGVSVAHLKRMNNLSSNKIIAGKNLIINRQQVAAKPAPAKTPVKEPVIQKPEPDNTRLAEQTGTEKEAEAGSFFADYYNSKKQVEPDDMPEDMLAMSADSLILENGKNEILERNNNEDARTIYHKVKIGETVLQIANKYDVSEKEVLDWNKMSSKKVKIGQRLMIKIPEKQHDMDINSNEELLVNNESGDEFISESMTESPAVISQNFEENRYVTTYYVKKGDSLSLIAQKFKGVSTKDIMTANNLANDKLSVGQKLKIPVN